MVKRGSIKLEIIDEQEVPSLLDLIDKAGQVKFETVDGELRPDVLDLYTSALGLYVQRRGTRIPVSILSAPGGPFDLMWREKWTRNDSWLGDWLGWLLYRKPKVVSRTRKTTDVSLFELHCPHVDGASASLSLESTSQESTTFKLFLAGNGCGRGKVLDIKVNDTMTVEGGCLKVVCPLTYEEVVYSHKDGVSFTWLEPVSIDYGSSEVVSDVTDDEDPCCSLDDGTAIDPNILCEEYDFDMTGATSGTRKKEFTLEEGVTYTASAGLALRSIRTGLELAYVFEQKSTLSVVMPVGYHYVGYRPVGCLNVFWSSKGRPESAQGGEDSEPS